MASAPAPAPSPSGIINECYYDYAVKRVRLKKQIVKKEAATNKSTIIDLSISSAGDDDTDKDISQDQTGSGQSQCQTQPVPEAKCSTCHLVIRGHGS